MKRKIPMAIFAASMLFQLLGLATARAAQAKTGVTWACAATIPDASFYTDVGSMNCSDDLGGAKTELMSTGKKIFCMYDAICAPATVAVQSAVLTAYNLKAMKKLNEYSEISDDDVAQTLSRIAQDGTFTMTDAPTRFALNCLGDKVDGAAKCPSLNACANTKGSSSKLWNFRKLESQTRTVQGVQVRTRGPNVPDGLGEGAPKGVVK